jgi:hypothetical protein
VTPAELDQLMRSRIGAAPLAPPSEREQFDALERHRAAQRWQWFLGAAVALGSIYWLSTRVARVEVTLSQLMQEEDRHG